MSDLSFIVASSGILSLADPMWNTPKKQDQSMSSVIPQQDDGWQTNLFESASGVLEFKPYDTTTPYSLSKSVDCEECGAAFVQLESEDFKICRTCDKKPKKYINQSDDSRRIIFD